MNVPQQQLPLLRKAKREFLLFFFALVLVVLLVLVARLPSAISPQPTSSLDVLEETAAVTIVFSESEHARSFRGSVIAGMTVVDALQLSARAGNFDVLFNEQGAPFTIDGISGRWSVVQNGESVLLPLTQMSVEAGDEIVLLPVEQ